MICSLDKDNSSSSLYLVFITGRSAITKEKVNKIVNKIEHSGKMENTIIVVVGDHGEEFNEFGRFAHSYSLKNVQTSTPFIMHIPNTKKTQFNITSHADIMPTIIDYLNISIPFETFLSGKSLLKYDQSDLSLIHI